MDVPGYLVNGEISCPYRVCFESTLFIMVMDVKTEDVRDGSLMELLYADDLISCGESLNKVMEKYRRWKKAVEGKSLRVNVDKTNCMQILCGIKSSISKVGPCGVFGERIGCNSIQFTKCQKWVHPRCSDESTHCTKNEAFH